MSATFKGKGYVYGVVTGVVYHTWDFSGLAECADA
jgi:hypothetical protein